MRKRSPKGYTIIELMVAVSLIGVVAGMLYLYNNKGWVIFRKTLSFAHLQVDARAALEGLVANLKRSSSDLIYTSSVYNSRVPFPEDAIYGKPYIYFAVPHKQDFKARDIKSQESTVKVPNYDYYLYYIASTTDKDGFVLRDRARLKLFLIKNQDGNYTINNSKSWPFIPPQLYGLPEYGNTQGTAMIGQVSDVQFQDISNEFSLYQSYFNFNYFNTEYKNLFKIEVKMIDTKTNTKINFETAINPRN